MHKRILGVSAMLAILLVGISGAFVAVRVYAAPHVATTKTLPKYTQPTARLTKNATAHTTRTFAQNAAYLKGLGKRPTTGTQTKTTPLACNPISSGFFSGGTAAFINPSATVTGVIDASNCEFAVYVSPGHSATVDNASISGSFYGVVGDGGSITITNSTITNTFLAAGIGADGTNTASAQITNSSLTFNLEGFFAGPVVGTLAQSATLTNVTAASNFGVDVSTAGVGNLTIHGGQYNGGIGVIPPEQGINVSGGAALVLDSNAQVTGNNDSGLFVDSSSSAKLDHVTVSSNAQDTTLSHLGGVVNYGTFYARYSDFGNDNGLTDGIANAGLLTVDDSSIGNDSTGVENISQAQVSATTMHNFLTAVYNHGGARIQLSLVTITNAFGGVYNGFDDTANDGSVAFILGGTSVSNSLFGLFNVATLVMVGSKSDNDTYGLANGQFAIATLNFSELLHNSSDDINNQTGGVLHIHATTFVTLN